MSKRGVIIGLSIIAILLIGAGVLWWRHSPPAGVPPVDKKPAGSSTQTTDRTSQIIAGMSLRDKASAMFIFHTPGTDPETLKQYLDTYKLAGIMFSGDNVPPTIQQLRAQTDALRADNPVPPLIAIDQEGDTVKRLSSDTFAGALTLDSLPPNATKTAFSGRSGLLRRAGINLNFGIVADVTADPNSFIFRRVLGTTPTAASLRVAAAVEGSKGKTLTTLKHFPGHGQTTANSHTSIPATAISRAAWQAADAGPFEAGIQAGADLVMTGQLRYSAVDQKPASLSKAWIDILRTQLGFKGTVITDDMIMLLDSGEADYTNAVTNAVAAIAAGNDLVLYVLDHGAANTKIAPNVLIDGVVAAVKDGRLSENQLNQSLARTIALRLSTNDFLK